MTATCPVLLPKPKQVIITEKMLDISDGFRIFENCFSEKIGKALEKILFSQKIRSDGEIPFVLCRKATLKEEAYELRIRANGVSIAASSDVGAYYALLTFGQIIMQNERGKVACIEIFDEPDFPNRGVMVDVSRNRIPTLSTLKYVVDIVSELKMNQFQLYFEGKPFLYPSFSEYYDEKSDILTCEEIKELETYCKARFVDFVPNLNCFGHMSEWLDCDAFRHLAECPEGFSYYGTHMPPSTLNPLLKESENFVFAQIDDLLPLFSSDKVNIGGDEPFELGEGASKEACRKRGKAEVYFDFMKKVFAKATEYGKSPMMWGDVFKEHYEICKGKFPKDVTVLEWGYEADSFNDDICAMYESAGIKYYLCPGTSLWNTVTGKTDNMLTNVKSAARLGKKHGADGMLLVDWGDGGSCQPLACSLSAYAVGAAYFWNAEKEQNGAIVDYLNRVVFEDGAETIAQLIFDLGNYYKCADRDDPNATKIFKALYVQQTDCMNVFEGNYEPLFSNRDFNYLKAEEYERTKSYLSELKVRLTSVKALDLYKRELGWAIDYLIHGCKIGELKASSRQFSCGEIQALEREIADLNEEYKDLWYLKNKCTGLKESMLRMNALQRKYAAIGEKE